ncbi:MAG: hypothetical protein AABW90_03340 [Nanoarchaeota archaeon]
MCECYDPNGQKYCNIHKELTNNSNKLSYTGLEGLIKEAQNQEKTYH